MTDNQNKNLCFNCERTGNYPPRSVDFAITFSDLGKAYYTPYVFLCEKCVFRITLEDRLSAPKENRECYAVYTAALRNSGSDNLGINIARDVSFYLTRRTVAKYFTMALLEEFDKINKY